MVSIPFCCKTYKPYLHRLRRYERRPASHRTEHACKILIDVKSCQAPRAQRVYCEVNSVAVRGEAEVHDDLCSLEIAYQLRLEASILGIGPRGTFGELLRFFVLSCR